jgi:hypothetical protein
MVAGTLGARKLSQLIGNLSNEGHHKARQGIRPIRPYQAESGGTII